MVLTHHKTASQTDLQQVCSKQSNSTQNRNTPNLEFFEEANPVTLLWQFPWLSQAKLAKALGVSKTIVSHWVCGRRNPCRTIRRLTWELEQQLQKWSSPHFLFSFSTEKINPIQLLKKYPGLSRAELAEALGVGNKTVDCWCCGINNPSGPRQRLAWELDKKWSAVVQGNSLIENQKPEKQIA
jgi:DNA-binding transcriptional regulator YiaG